MPFSYVGSNGREIPRCLRNYLQRVVRFHELNPRARSNKRDLGDGDKAEGGGRMLKCLPRGEALVEIEDNQQANLNLRSEYFKMNLYSYCLRTAQEEALVTGSVLSLIGGVDPPQGSERGPGSEAVRGANDTECGDFSRWGVQFSPRLWHAKNADMVDRKVGTNEGETAVHNSRVSMSRWVDRMNKLHALGCFGILQCGRYPKERHFVS